MCARVCGQKDFTLAGSPFPEPEDGAGGRAGRNKALPVGRVQLRRFAAFSEQPRLLGWHPTPLAWARDPGALSGPDSPPFQTEATLDPVRLSGVPISALLLGGCVTPGRP